MMQCKLIHKQVWGGGGRFDGEAQFPFQVSKFSPFLEKVHLKKLPAVNYANC